MNIKPTLTTLLILGASLNAAAQNTPVYLDRTKPIEQRVEDALSRLTLEEKVAMIHGQGTFSSPGSRRLGIPELYWNDSSHGVHCEDIWTSYAPAGQLNDSVTSFPALTALAATWNRSLAGLYGKSVGEEARYRDKDVLLGPGLNIYRTPLCGRNFEYLGEDPYLAGEMAAEYVKELQKNGVAACLKHFAVNNQEKWRLYLDVKVSDRALYEIYLPAFKKAIQKGGAWALMGAYNKYAGTHCSHNKRLLVDILRNEWNWDGVVVSDWGGAHDTREAVHNGLDVEMGSWSNDGKPGFTYKDYFMADPYLAKMRSGEIDSATINNKVRNVLRLIFRTAMNPDKPYGNINEAAHYAAARAIGNEAVVLLKNNGILPLDPAKAGRVLVVGENAVHPLNVGGGASEIKAKDMFKPLDAIRRVYGKDVKYARGYKSGKYVYTKETPVPQSITDSLRAEAVAMAADADVIIYVGGMNKNAFQDCEHTDRRDMSLSFGQDRLIEELAAVCPNIIIANISGNGYSMPWLDKVPAVLQCWQLGTMLGPVMTDIISGKANPSGKLPFSIPRKLEDNGAHHFGEKSYPGVATAPGANSYVVEYLDDIYVGYRWHDTKRIPALFPFGYGLSYTTFKYGKPTASATEMSADGNITINIPITNTGKVEGKETVQLYIEDVKSSLPRPLKELKSFEKVSLRPGETANVSFTITAEDLKYFDDTRHEWVAEPGKFRAHIAASSADVRATVNFTLK